MSRVKLSRLLPAFERTLNYRIIIVVVVVIIIIITNH